MSVARRLFSEKQTDARPSRWWRRVAIVLAGIGLVIGVIYVAIVVAFPPARLAVSGRSGVEITDLARWRAQVCVV